jgi:hypothetical protein
VVEAQMSMDSAATSGEPWVAINPQNPQIVIATWTPIVTSSTSASSADSNFCPVGRSTDGGKTWTLIDTKPWGSHSGPIGDPAIGVGSDGSFYVLCSYAFSEGIYLLIKSSDGGATWSNSVQVADGAGTYSDRPDVVVDSATGDVYVTATDNSTLGRGFSVSTDGGNTWTKFQPLAPNGECVWGDRVAAAGGVLAAGYNHNPSSAGSGASDVTCTTACTVFETSADHGSTWSRHVVPVQTIVAGGAAGGPRVHVAADPAHGGRFAVLVPTNSSSSLEIWVTEDTGMNWKQAKVLAAASGDTQAKWAMAYSPTGALGVVWRTLHSDNTYDVSAIVSTDGGFSFGAVVPLTAKPTGPTSIGDDCACNVNLDKSTLATGWADLRTGNEEAWFGRFDYTSSTCN